MSVLLLKALVTLVLLAALMSVPFGVPGVWFMIAALFGAVLAGWVDWPVWCALTALALLSEILEFVILERMGRRFGGTRGAFWGALAGGLAGVVIGLPVPLVGPLFAGFLGTFMGAAAVTFCATRSMDDASRVGWGMLLARVLSVGLKVGVGIAILFVGITALVIG